MSEDIIIGQGTNYLKIETVTAYVSVDENGHEGIISIYTPHGWTPCIGADEEKVKSLYPIVKDLCQRNNQKFRVLHFSIREDVTDELKARYEN